MQKILFSNQKEINFIFTELFIILKIECPTDSIMNNSVKIKFNFFPVRKKNHHKNLFPEFFPFFLNILYILHIFDVLILQFY